jgi:hypothetical protein
MGHERYDHEQNVSAQRHLIKTSAAGIQLKRYDDVVYVPAQLHSIKTSARGISALLALL